MRVHEDRGQESTVSANANPTKRFFISMLTKDIGLIPAILDLIDNSVDGARRLRSDEDWQGLEIDIRIAQDSFRISDKCGGIPLEEAEDYAFRFGRDPDAQPTPRGGIGEFGVGMKRALFKLGRSFTIDSVSENSGFHMAVDVEAWQRTEDWNFRISPFDPGRRDPSATLGTDITVRDLYETIAEEFSQDIFADRLAEHIEIAHVEALGNGLTISVNGGALQYRPPTLLVAEEIRPVFTQEQRNGVTVRLYVGVAESSPDDAGWYVYCNDRLLMRAEQSGVTGWGSGRGTTGIPKYHPQFARFRGHVYLDAESPESLPWNTTKTGVDRDSPVYVGVRREMITKGREIIDFLNDLKDEEQEDAGPLSLALDSAQPTALADIEVNEHFDRPPKQEVPQETIWIRYSMDAAKVEAVKRVVEDAASNADIGRTTFMYFYAAEVDDIVR